MARSTVFMNNKSQAVRLPKPVALPESVKKVDIIKVGRARVITPAGENWDAWFDRERVSDDFLPQRDQAGDQERESL